MGIWRVYYQGWQMECCGTPFAVGDEVSWPLLLDMGYDDWTDAFSAIVGPVEEVRDEEDEVIRFLRTDDGVAAALNGDPAGAAALNGDPAGAAALDGDPAGAGGLDPGRWVRRAGLLTVERHSGEWPETAGRVRAIHLVRQVYEESGPGSRSYAPVPGERSLEAVRDCPKWFGQDEDDVRTATGAARRRIQGGVLVELETTGATPPEPRDRR